MNPSRFNVTFDSPSPTSAGSLPLGNGDVALNAWLEPGGDVLFYIAKSDAWDEHGRLIKIGRVRIRLNPNPFLEASAQTLHLDTGELVITGGGLRLSLLVDANRPVVWIEAESGFPVSLTVSRDSWRDLPRELSSEELHCIDEWDAPMLASADHVIEVEGRSVWFHRNEQSLWRRVLEHQGFGDFAACAADPILHRTFGAGIFGNAAAPASRHRVGIAVLTEQTTDAKQWLEQLDALMSLAETTAPDEVRRDHSLWWEAFWERSHIEVQSPLRASEGKSVTECYVLQRYQLACAGRGAYPIKFNGSLFTADWQIEGNFQGRSEATFDADYRRWGGAYWFQNTRLAYWPMLAAGDYEMMDPLFRMYRDALALCEERSRVWFDHEGAYFPETMYFFGAHLSGDYGLDRSGKVPGDVENGWIGLQRCAVLELLVIGLDRFAHTGDLGFLGNFLLPLARAATIFYDRHYLRDEQKRICLAPAQCLEQFWNVVNPTPDLAGLHHVLPRLISLPQIEADDRSFWLRLLESLPPIPIGEVNGQPGILPAQQILERVPRNKENPELYAVFPYRLFSRTRDLEIGRWTFANRIYQDTSGWQQDAVQAACLGLTATARYLLLKNCGARSPHTRFPGFFGPNFDWVPDQDHAGINMIALQSMLLQIDGDKILLFPAWPADWDVNFKLHAPRQTVLVGILRNGRLEELHVNPPERRADVVNCMSKDSELGVVQK
jgi:hypothetical protein